MSSAPSYCYARTRRRKGGLWSPAGMTQKQKSLQPFLLSTPATTRGRRAGGRALSAALLRGDRSAAGSLSLSERESLHSHGARETGKNRATRASWDCPLWQKKRLLGDTQPANRSPPWGWRQPSSQHLPPPPPLRPPSGELQAPMNQSRGCRVCKPPRFLFAQLLSA